MCDLVLKIMYKMKFIYKIFYLSRSAKGSCVTCHGVEDYVQDEVYLQDILLVKVCRLTMYPRLIP